MVEAKCIRDCLPSRLCVIEEPVAFPMRLVKVCAIKNCCWIIVHLGGMAAVNLCRREAFPLPWQTILRDNRFGGTQTIDSRGNDPPGITGSFPHWVQPLDTG